ncbi:MAG: ATP-dependent zinc metalloprotease FtsH [Abditibacteriota bacterium]|nr:ATP-dependent zinc metalloprotease FtsH [Abditibacteriota bacterium]
MKKLFRTIVYIIIIILVAVLIYKGDSIFGKAKPTQEIPYSQMIAKINKGDVTSAHIRKDLLEIETKNSDKFKAKIDINATEELSKLHKLLQEHNVKYEVNNSPISEIIMSMVISVIIPLAFFFFLWTFMIRGAGGGGGAMNFGKSRAKKMHENFTKVTFKDVAGIEEAKNELAEVVDFLRNPKKYTALGAKIPKGILLLGPPGCGKTLLARAVAGEANVPFFYISGSDFVEMFVGVGASRVRDLFNNARQERPCLIFIDEIDAVGRQRGTGLGGGNDEREQTLNQLLIEMDGFEANSGVILIAATNRPDVLDPALLRPGRFDRQVVVDSPDVKGREQILTVHLRNKPTAEDVNPKIIAERTAGFSGADLANLVNEAALIAAKNGQAKVENSNIDDAIDKVIAGPEKKSRLIHKDEKKITAYHEAGHAIVMERFENNEKVHKVSIMPRGRALGLTWYRPDEDKYLITKTELKNKICGLLGGRVAEEAILNECTTGASNDLERATNIVRQMVCELGMSDNLGPVVFGKRSDNPFLGRDFHEQRNYSENIAEAIDKEIQSIVASCYEIAKEIILEEKDKLEKVVEVLIEKETIEREEFLEIVNPEKLAQEKAEKKKEENKEENSQKDKEEISLSQEEPVSESQGEENSQEEEKQSPQEQPEEENDFEDTDQQ